MKREDDLELAVRQAYANAPVPNSLTAAARALLDAEGTPRTSSTASEPLTVGHRGIGTPAGAQCWPPY